MEDEAILDSPPSKQIAELKLGSKNVSIEQSAKFYENLLMQMVEKSATKSDIVEITNLLKDIKERLPQLCQLCPSGNVDKHHIHRCWRYVTPQSKLRRCYELNLCAGCFDRAHGACEVACTKCAGPHANLTCVPALIEPTARNSNINKRTNKRARYD